uniref:Glycosyltransferase 61 catalytic domain-containing protein n=1 Tax=Hyaloperonospora arabidopsidis (strain Emoy2) TaxID=559515 RepID=M4C2I0_HYAAE
MGIIAAVHKSAKTFCASGGWDHSNQAPASPTQATKVSRFYTRGGIYSTVLQNLMLDFVDVSIHAPIKSIADDDFHHDPRFNFNTELINCVCDEYAKYFQKLAGEKERIEEMMWRDLLMAVPNKNIPEPVFCSVKRPPGRNRSRWDFVEHPTKAPDEHETVVFEDPVVLVARHDDHNPFFQLSSAYNAWIMLKALEWDTTKTRPVIQHVDHNESCYDSELLKTFRAQSLRMLNVTPEVEREIGVARIRPMYVTVITRQPYAGRKLQRMWRNENEVMRKMRKDYKDLKVQFRSIDYVNLTLHEQMTTTIESDVIVSMHGAGLVNIFPKEKYRYGYRNICQHVGYDYHEFRGGEDVSGGSTPNTKNKRIPYAEWKNFFHPLFQQSYDAFEEQQAVLRGGAS